MTKDYALFFVSQLYGKAHVEKNRDGKNNAEELPIIVLRSNLWERVQQLLAMNRLFLSMCGFEKSRLFESQESYLLLEYLVTALVPSLTACLANSPGRRSRTAVWISRELIVDFLLY